MRDVDLINAFEERWKEAKASGKTGILFPKEKWFMIDLLLQEAKRSDKMQRARERDAEHIQELEDELSMMKKGLAILRRDLIASRAGKRTKKHELDDGEPLFDKGMGKVLSFPAAG